MAETNPILVAANPQTNVQTSERTTEIVRAKSEPPVPVEDLASQVVAAGKDSRAASAEVISTMKVEEPIITEAMRTAANARNAIEVEKLTAAMQTQNASIDVFRNMGGPEQLYRMAQHHKEVTDYSMQQQKDVMELEKVNLRDDGFWATLGAQLRLGFVEEDEARRAAIAVNDSASNMRAMETVSSSAGKVLLNAEKTITEQTIQDLQEAQSAELTKQMAERRIALAERNAKAVQQNFNNTAEEARIINSLRTSEYQLKAAGRQLKILEMEEATDKRIAEAANRKFVDLGLERRYDEVDVRARRALGGTAVEELMNDFREGQMLEHADADPRIGNSFSEGTTLAIEGTSGRALLHSPKISKHVTDMRLRAQTKFAEAGADPKTLTEAEMHKVINEINDEVVKTERKEQPSEGKSLFSSPPWAIMLNHQAVKDTKLYEEVWGPLTEVLSKKDALSEQQAVDLAVSAVADKKLSPEQAAHELATLFISAANMNNASEQYGNYHIDPQSTYNVRLYDTVNTRVLADEAQIASALPAYLMGGDTSVYNLMDETHLLRFIIKRTPKASKLFD